MKPWKRRGFAGKWRGLVEGFNGATAMKPWKSDLVLASPTTTVSLQWGHGDEAVEEASVRLGLADPVDASMGPRR